MTVTETITPTTKQANKALVNQIDGKELPSLVEIKSKIPEQCFQPDMALAFYYIFRAFFFVAALFATMYTINSYIENTIIKAISWAAYIFLQGTVFWGIFVLGHDCGHSSFSNNATLNRVVGNLLHAPIFVPYECWRLSHRYHHKNTGNMDRDEIYFPHRLDDSLHSLKRALPGSLGTAWFLYLWGAQGVADGGVKHFTPNNALFKGYYNSTLASIVCVFGVFGLSCYAVKLFGFTAVALYYYAPLHVFASWLVITTFLHHNHPESPWYSDDNWNYVKGNLSSVDRSYYPFDDIVHNIGTHQIHHLFPKIPHYKLVEATKHFRKAYPHLVLESDEHNLPAFFKNWYDYFRYGVAAPEVKVFKYSEIVPKKK